MQFDPIPRPKPSPYEPFVWPVGSRWQLAPRSVPLEVDLVSLIERRQSRRQFKQPLDYATLGEFLWLTCRNRSSRPSPFGPDQESRVHPSGGAMHPIHVLISEECGPWTRYDPSEHVLSELVGSRGSAAVCREVASRLLELGHGTLLGFVAEPGKTAAKYENHETIVWRDAGVVLGFMSLVAEALDLAFCPLGITGAPYLTDYLAHASALNGVGLAVLSAK